MAASGMLIAGADIPEPYDRFRHRVMFPILDMKGRVIAFGGRALEKDVPAKYLNSPETPLFHKGHILFNAARARPVAHDRDRIIAVEGYMDVVALHEGGFRGSGRAARHGADRRSGQAAVALCATCPRSASTATARARRLPSARSIPPCPT